MGNVLILHANISMEIYGEISMNSMEMDIIILHGIPLHGGFSHGKYHAYGFCLDKKKEANLI